MSLKKAGCDVTLLSIENADHADIHFFKQIWDEICTFFKDKAVNKEKRTAFLSKSNPLALPRSAVEDLNPYPSTWT